MLGPSERPRANQALQQSTQKCRRGVNRLEKSIRHVWGLARFRKINTPCLGLG